MPHDAFDILGIAPSFDLDSAAIDRAYFERSRVLHPDVASADADAPTRMAALNEARAALRDPERRADVLLLRLGGPAREREKGLPDGFLMEMMEVRQEIEAALASGEPAQRQRWEAWADRQRNQAIADVSGLFRSAADAPTPDALRSIRVRLNAWRYIERLIEQLDPDYNPAHADFRPR